MRTSQLAPLADINILPAPSTSVAGSSYTASVTTFIPFVVISVADVPMYRVPDPRFCITGRLAALNGARPYVAITVASLVSTVVLAVNIISTSYCTLTYTSGVYAVVGNVALTTKGSASAVAPDTP